MRGSTISGVRTLEVRQGSRGSYQIAGDEDGYFDFPDDESREAKIRELVAGGAVLK